MKATLATLILYIYERFIYEDWDIYTKAGKIFIYPFWLIRCVYVILGSPILALGYYWEKTPIYAHFEEVNNQAMAMMDKLNNQAMAMMDELNKTK